MAQKSSNVIKPLRGIRKYFIIRINSLIQRYEQMMSTRFPSTYRMLQMFTVGTRDFSKDVLQYMRISKDLTFNRSVNDLTYQELMIYMQTPKDIIKMTPFLVITVLPLAQYVTLPLAFMFPKQLLSSHYWTIEQRTKFAVEDHRKRLYHYRPVFRCLQRRLNTITPPILLDKCRYAFTRLGSGTHPNVEQIIDLKPIFTRRPYHINSLSHKHLVHLCRIHGLGYRFLLKKHRLKSHISFIQELDNALIRDNCLEKNELTFEELKKACFLRGLNPINLTSTEMKQWLNHWAMISQSVDEENLSLLLHSPIFLAYNHPSNWRLIH